MTRFLAYFDLLGYKNFIEKNTVAHLDYRTEHFARNIEMALSDGKRKDSIHPGAYISDISQSNVNTLNFSDTVVFWTNGNSFQDFNDILKVSFAYNYFNVCYDFPSRGCIVYDDIWFKDFSQTNNVGSRYMLNMIYGKALIKAHSKAECLDWAGCVLDISAIEYAKQLGNIDSLIKEYALLYNVPYKKSEPINEYALKLIKDNLNETAFGNISQSIASSFTQDNKGAIIGRVKEIYDNTIEFLVEHKMKFPYYYHIPTNGTEEVFGKIDNKISTIVTKNNSPVSYKINTGPFDADKDRNVYSAEESSVEIFEEQYNNAVKQSGNPAE